MKNSTLPNWYVIASQLLNLRKKPYRDEYRSRPRYPYCQTRPSNERVLRRCLKARVGMAKRGGACASLAERGRLRRPERGDYLPFVVHQERGRENRWSRRTRLRYRPGLLFPKAHARSRIILRPRHYPPHRRFTVGASRADCGPRSRLRSRSYALTARFSRSRRCVSFRLRIAKGGNASLRARMRAQHFIRDCKRGMHMNEDRLRCRSGCTRH